MADILQRYGIKEVADVTFYEITETGEPGAPVLILDSLKVTSIEQTAETAEARGGKGNAKLIVWDFGKEITVTIEDALFSPKSLSIMFANGNVIDESTVGSTSTTDYGYVKKSARVIATSDGAFPAIKIDDATLKSDAQDLKFFDGTGTTVSADKVKKGQVLYATWKHQVATKSTITITPDSFPGTYYVVGDTMVRSERTGKDEYFQFIIPKAKMQAEQTISMEAEGDPSTFNMSLQVLRPENKEMVKFIKYEFGLGIDDNPWTTETTESDWNGGFETSSL